MGLIITNEICTDAGLTSELYLNIRRFEIVKDSVVVINLNRYLNKEARLANERDIVNTRQVRDILHINYSEIKDLINSSTLHEAIYTKLKESLTTTGLATVDDTDIEIQG